jgi:hypothetical protein
MPKQERNKQFVEIESKIGTYLTVLHKSVDKEPIHFDEFLELKTVTQTLATQRGMSLSEWYRWLNMRYLSVHGYIPVEVERQNLALDINENKPYTKLRGSQNGKLAFIKSEQKFNQMQRDGTAERMLNEAQSYQARTQESL